MSRVIVAATPLAGHTLPLIQIADALVAAGHDVVFVGGERYADQVKAAGAELHALTGKAGYDDRRLNEFFPRRATLPPGPAQLREDIARIFGDAIPEQHAQLQRLLDEDPDRVLVTDQLFLGAWPSAFGAGLRPRRWVAVGVSPLYVPSDDASPMGPVPVPPGGDQGAANRAAAAGFEAAIADGVAHVRQILSGLGADLTRFEGYLGTAYRLPDLLLQPTVPEFEFPRGDLPENIRFIGPLPMPKTPGWTPPHWWDELDGRPVVVVTQGTLANADLSALVEPALTALAGEEVLVVAALGGRDPEAVAVDVPANARVERFVPFDRMLPRADVLITNGGYGGVQVSLAAGTPVIVAGVTEDKPATAARVVFAGVGVDLATERPTPEQIRDAVRTVLANPGFAERVATLRTAYEKYDSLAAIRAAVEG